MNGRSWQQQKQRYAPADILYSSSSPYWMEGTTTPPMLRSSWSSSTTDISSTASTKQQSHSHRQRHSRKSHCYGQNTDHDRETYTSRHLSRYDLSSSGKQHVFDKNYTGANPKLGTPPQRRQQQLNDYLPPTMRYADPQYQPQFQRQRRASIQHSSSSSSPANAPCPIKNNNNNSSNCTKKEMNRSSIPLGKEKSRIGKKLSMEKTMNNHQPQHGTPPKDEIQIQRKPIQRQRKHSSISPSSPPPPISTTLDINNYQQQHHVGAPAGWKMSGQYDHLVLRSPLSPTPPPSLLDSSSSSNSNSSSSTSASPSMTLSYPSENYQQRSTSTNGLIYHRKAGSNDGVTGYDKRSQRQRHSGTTITNSIAAAALPGPTNSHGIQPSLSASTSHRPLVHYQAVRSPSTHSIGAPSRHSYEDQQSYSESFAGERPRRYSQGDCSSNNNRTPPVSSQPHAFVSRRVSTPKLRRVCSAKPCIDLPPFTTQQKDNDGMIDPFLDAISLSAAKQQQQQQQQQQLVPTFWNPRSTRSALPVKRTLSRRIRGLLLPQRTKLEDISVSNDQQLAVDYQWSLTRPTTPANDMSIDNDAILEDQENEVMDNPFYMISQSWDIVDQAGLHFSEDDFVQMDTYATSVQQIGPSLTPQVLSQRFLVRPYRRDLYRLRIIFMWIIQNIGIVDQRGNPNGSHPYDGCGNDTATTTTMMADTIQQQQQQPAKISLRQRLTSRRNLSASDHEEEMEMPVLDVMHGDGLLPEAGGGDDVGSFDDWLFSESAHQVLHHRVCSSSIGMANLFCEMATAAGFSDTRVVYGYLRAPKDSIQTASMDMANETDGNSDNGESDDGITLVQNHAWCYVKVEGEYRFIDCWLASPFQPQNKIKTESTHWFLTKPTQMIYTHFPQEASDQCLKPTIDVTTFFALPYVWASFFLHHIKMIRYNPDVLALVDDDQVCHLMLRVDPGINCFAFVETDRFSGSSNSNQPTTIIMRCLAQSRMIPDEKTGLLERVFKVKAVLPPGHDGGWLKIYAGASSSSSASHQSVNPLSSSSSSTTTTTTTTTTRQDNGSSSSSSRYLLANNNATVPANDPLPPLAVCFRLTAQHQDAGRNNNRLRPFEFVHIHPCRHEFYIREPQCYLLYPLQTYNFLVRGDDTHHKLAIKSPSGKLYKLMYYPQEHTYDGSVKISESGKWSLISLLHNAGGWFVVATWECRG